MQANGDRFEAAYNRIDALLRKKVGGARDLSFSAIVQDAARKDATVRANRENLLEYAELRNAIVHNRGKTPVLLADPRDDVVVDIERICEWLSHPKTLRQLTRSPQLRIFPASDALPEALLYMRENDFSQVIALQGGRYIILSREGIAHWLANKSKEDMISISDTRLSDVLSFEPKNTCVYLKPDDTIDLAGEVFANDIGKRIFCVLVTQHATPKERPINIVTPWDFLAAAYGVAWSLALPRKITEVDSSTTFRTSRADEM
jgi:hypothetical protein